MIGQFKGSWLNVVPRLTWTGRNTRSDTGRVWSNMKTGGPSCCGTDDADEAVRVRILVFFRPAA